VSRFQFVADHQHAYGVKRLCGLLTVSRSGFYQWRRTVPARAERQHADQVLTAQIAVIHRASDDTYGSPRVTAELRDTDRMVNHKRVERLMRRGGIVGVHLRKKIRTTIPAPDQIPVADLIQRVFTAPKPNQKYVGDIKCRRRHLMSYADRRTMPIIPAFALVTPLLRFGRSA
jgi:hypothetical protein